MEDRWRQMSGDWLEAKYFGVIIPKPYTFIIDQAIVFINNNKK